jgi:predicted peroxiredoxin
MNRLNLILICLMVIQELFAQSPGVSDKSATKLLIHITVGPENPTRAALGFLTAKTALDEGYTVTLFLAGDGVQLLRDDVLDNLAGLGTGKLREHYDAIVKKGGKFYLSGMSSKARGVSLNDLKNKPAELAMPDVLVRLSVESDRMFVY